MAPTDGVGMGWAMSGPTGGPYHYYDRSVLAQQQREYARLKAKRIKRHKKLAIRIRKRKRGY